MLSGEHDSRNHIMCMQTSGQGRNWGHDDIFPSRILLKVAFFCVILVTASTTESESDSIGQGDMTTRTCNQVCDYDDWFKRASCEERGLHHVPNSAGCENIRLFDLNNNFIASLTVESFLGYRQTTTLDVSENDITIIDPGTFVNTPHLKNIYASGNNLPTLNDWTFNGTEHQLRILYLNANRLKNIEENAFRDLRSLVALYLGNNKLSQLPQLVFRDLHKLRYLVLSNNELTLLENGTFHGLTDLESLTLSNNKLSCIPEGLFLYLTSLREIILSNNNIVTFRPTVMSLIQYNVDTLDLSNNNINQSMDIIPFLNITERLYIDGNPFICDCQFQRMKEWYHAKYDTESSVRRINSITCKTVDGNVTVSDYLCNFTGIQTTNTPHLKRPSSNLEHNFGIISDLNEKEGRTITQASEDHLSEDEIVQQNTNVMEVVTLKGSNHDLDSMLLYYIAGLLTLFCIVWSTKEIIILISKLKIHRKETLIIKSNQNIERV